jgi:hypothetical protein
VQKGEKHLFGVKKRVLLQEEILCRDVERTSEKELTEDGKEDI